MVCVQKKYFFLFSYCLLAAGMLVAQNDPVLHFGFDGNVKSEIHEFSGNVYGFVSGIDGQGLSLNPTNGFVNLDLSDIELDESKDFSVQFWVKLTSSNPTVFLSQKNFDNKSIAAQQNAGWALYSSGGTWAWSVGSGDRRTNYERDNGEHMPINDGVWHQITMTYSTELSEFRLYYDGRNKAIYKVNFAFGNDNPLRIGSGENLFDYENMYSPAIDSGLVQLQKLVDEFNGMGIGEMENEEFFDLIVDPEKLYESKQSKPVQPGEDDPLSDIIEIRKKMASNAYTVYQNRALTNLKPVSQIYTLKDGKVVIDDSVGQFFTKGEKIYPSDFAMDELQVWEKVISSEEVLKGYLKYKSAQSFKHVNILEDFTVGVWNIWHGGIHWSMEKDGWDSRLRIVEMIKVKNLDVVLFQETYSSGDFIAAELGYYYASTSDWDYRFQGENISVISRYPIVEVEVSSETEFNNVGVKLTISATQQVWAMSNWYGMTNFPTVFDFHQSRFTNSENVPVFFGGDFNAVPHTDGGESPASKELLSAGFTDAFRSLHPGVEQYPGFTHRSGDRIDQLYYKGKGVVNTSTEVIQSWPTGFPSDHYLIVSKFVLNN